MFVSDSAYDAFMGRYSRGLAVVFADFAGVVSGRQPPTSSATSPVPTFADIM